MTDLIETMEVDAVEVDEDVVAEAETEIAVAPARPRLPAYVSHF